jgi:hypothetical protein
MISPNPYRIFGGGCGGTFSATIVRRTEKKGGGGEDNINVYVLKLACDCIKWSGSFIPLSMMNRWVNGWMIRRYTCR